MSKLQKLNRIDVPLPGASYPIVIGNKWLHKLGHEVAAVMPDLTHAVIICDESVEKPWAETIYHHLPEEFPGGLRIDLVTIPSGEASKCVDQLSRLWSKLLGFRTDRTSAVIAVGGGVTGDLAGMVAATFMRGIRLIAVPTSLLAQVDSSVGGKTGINLPSAKNMVGSFWQPRLVAIDTATLTTLPPREYISGLAEVVKYGLIQDAEFFAWLDGNSSLLLQREPSAVQHAIGQSCQCKADVVLADQFETTGRRAILNYGHTFGHAIEATAGYGHFLHGEAIAIGMEMAARLAVALGRVDQRFCDEQTKVLQKLQLPIAWPDADTEAMCAAMLGDKKTEHGRLRFILPSRLGEVTLVDEVPDHLVRAAINACR